ncbi:MAG: DUF523 domain-containing protein [Eubacterium sp.]|nr:DUF523 domain-containing protein [Eubacterium sp.]
MKTRIVVSACLLGECCKYNGSHNRNEAVLALQKQFEIIPVCPECFGGLPIPRVPSERRDGRVFSKDGEDVTAAFLEGAEQTLYIAQEHNCPAAVLKERSPSCGCGVIYDGSFTGALTEGNGVTTDLLLQNAIAVFGESQLQKLINLYFFDENA